MRKYWLFGVLAALAIVLATGVSSAVYKSKRSGFAACTSRPEVSLRLAMRDLWDGHIALHGMYIDSAVAGLPNKDVLAKGLLKNGEAIGDAIKPYYGKAAGNKLTALLKEHIIVGGELIDATKSGDKAKAAELEKSWKANAAVIVAFLNKANPKYWPREDLSSMMDQHLELIKAIATADINKDYKAELSAYDRARVEASEMADMLSMGIVKQFPKKFKTREVFCG